MFIDPAWKIKLSRHSRYCQKSDRSDICWKVRQRRHLLKRWFRGGKLLLTDWSNVMFSQNVKLLIFSWFFLLKGWCCFLAWVLFDLLFFIHINKCRYSSIRYQKLRLKKTSLTVTSSFFQQRSTKKKWNWQFVSSNLQI
jgi:hypothetical protein